MFFVEFIAGLTPFKMIREWLHEITVREQNRLLAEIERQKIAAAREESLRQTELEKARIERSDRQHHRQIQLERDKELFEIVRLLVKEKLL